MSSQAALLFLTGPLAGKGKKLKKEITIIGRSSSCDICIADASISREHVKITFDNGVYSVKDLGSHNGIKVNDKKVEHLTLNNGIRFKLGAAEIEFWDGVGSPPATQQEITTPSPGEVFPTEISSEERAPSSRLAEMKQKRLINLVI